MTLPSSVDRETDAPAPTTPGSVVSILATFAVLATIAAAIATVRAWTATKVIACAFASAGEILIATGLWMTHEDFQDRRPQAIVEAARLAHRGAKAPAPATPDEVKAERAGGADAHGLPPADLVKAIGEAVKAASEGLSKLRPATQMIVLGFIAISISAALFRMTP